MIRRTKKYPLYYTLRMKSIINSTVRDGFYRSAFTQRRYEALAPAIEDYYYDLGYFTVTDRLNWVAEDLPERAPRLNELLEMANEEAANGFPNCRTIPAGCSMEDLMTLLGEN